MKHNFRPILITLSAIVFVEAILVLFFLDKFLINNLIGDEILYHQIALNLVEHQSFSVSLYEPFYPTTYRAAGYPLFLSVLYITSGKSFFFVYAVQFVLLGITSFYLYRLARYFTGNRESFLSGIICATYPPLVFLSTYHYTEILATCLAVIVVCLFVETKHSEKKFVRYIFIGLMIGFLSLTRQSFSIIISLFIAALILEKNSHALKQKILFSAIMLFGCSVVIAPWATRNILLTKQFIPFGTSGGESLYISAIQYEGKLSYAMRLEEWRGYLALRDIKEAKIYNELDNPESELSQKIDNNVPRVVKVEVLLDNQLKEEGKAGFGKLSLATILKGIPKRLAYLWSPSDMSPYAATNGFFHRFVQFSYLFIILFATIGFFLNLKFLSKHYALLLFPLYLTIIHIIFHVEPRYSIPARPFIFIYASVGMVWLFDFLRKRKQISSTIETSAK